MADSMKAMFAPNGVAIFGSAAPGKLANVLVHRVLEGGMERVYAVNPKGLGVDSVKGYASVLDIGEEIDLAVIASPAFTVKDIMEECGKKGIKAAVIISSGFSEAGNSGGEKEVMEVAKKYGIRCVGPNCAGLVNTHSNLVATLETKPPKGNISMVSQSGAIGGSFMALSAADGVGIAKFLSYGNGADLTAIDLLRYLKDDEETKVVAVYVESVANGRKFMETVKKVVAVKPVVIVKSGRSSFGQRAAMSHTGSMAGADHVFDAALKQCGAIRADTLKEMFEICKGFALMPPMKGRKVAVVTNSGGPGVMSTDRAESVGLDIPVSSDALKEELAGFLPVFAGMKNPIDLTVEGTGEQYEFACKAALKEMDGALAIYVGTPYLKSMPCAKGIAKAAKASGKPVTAMMQVGTDIEESLRYLRENKIPCYELGENAVSVLSKLAEYYEFVSSNVNVRCFYDIKKCGTLFEGRKRLLETEAMQLLRDNGIPVPEYAFATSAGEVRDNADKVGYPMVMKVVSPQIVHKSDCGGVILPISSAAEAVEAFHKLAAVAEGKDFRGAMMVPLLKPGREVILGLTKDPQFGMVVAFGMGGIYTEVLKDISLRIAPVTKETALCMVKEIKTYPILEGVRGQSGVDLDKLAEAISKFSELPFVYPDIKEADLNPVFLYENSLCVADARVLG